MGLPHDFHRTTQVTIGGRRDTTTPAASGYDIEFLTLRPGRFDLLLDMDPAHHALVSTLDALWLLTGREQAPVFD